ncbi:MAG: carbohydrate-binding domain-containing protein [Faecousia sp.]
MKRVWTICVATLWLLTCLTGCGGNSVAPTTTATEPTEVTSVTDPVAEVTESPENPDETAIVLSDSIITVNGVETGTGEAAVYLSHDIVYYEDLDTYDSGNAYGEGLAWERHSAEEAAAHTVVNITAPGTYRVSGSLSEGQLRVDLGDEAAQDPEAVVTLILDGVNLDCQVAPAILFLNVYECDGQWSVDTATPTVDTTSAGANLVLGEGSLNNVSGSHVAKIFKDNGEEKKLWKQDGAVYSYMSMNVSGEGDGSGILNLTADNEGLDTELHLTICSGNLNIRSGNDGINTNEDGVSVTTINGGSVHIIAGLGDEGDGIDSNGYLVINGGTVVSSANPASDAGLDSDLGSYVNGGTVVALGSTMDWAESDSQQVTMNLQFAQYRSSGDAIVVTKEDGTVIFAYDPSDDEVLGENTRQFMGAVISCPDFQVGDSYLVYVGGTLEGTETGGVYESVTIYTGGTQQVYTGTDVGRGPGGIFGGPMGGKEPGEGFDGHEPPEGFDGQEPPEGFDGQRHEMPEGERPEKPAGEVPPQMPEGSFGGQTGESQSLFYMQDKVNSFSGVTDMTEQNL